MSLTTPDPSPHGRMLIGGIGYRDLRDMSLGPVLMERLVREVWPPDIDIEDLSYSPIAVMQLLEERVPYERMILVAGVQRQRQPGELCCYRWMHQLPEAQEIQARVAEAVTGVISLDNLLIIATYFGKLPADVIVIEVEAADEGWGEGFTPAVEGVIPAVVDAIRHYALGG